MPTTPTYALPYPAPSDPADVPTDMQRLAQAVEAMPPLGYWTPLSPGNIQTTQVLWLRSPTPQVIADQAGGSAGYTFLMAKAAADTNYRFVIDVAGTLQWGPGNATQDINLYKSGPNLVVAPGSGGGFHCTGDVYSATGAANQILLSAGTGRLYFGSAADTNLYRASAQLLQTDSAFVAANGAGATGKILLGWAGGGYGVQIGGDTNLYRSAADTLKTDDTFNVQGSFQASFGRGTFRIGGSDQVQIGDKQGDGATACIAFGSAQDTFLYRRAAGVLGGSSFRSDGDLRANEGTANQVWVGHNGSALAPYIRFGSGAGDTTLYRSAAGQLTTDGSFEVKGSASPSRFVVSNNVYLGSTQLIFHDGTNYDTNLYRAAAGLLVTDTSFRARAANTWPSSATGIAYSTYLGGESFERMRIYGDGKLSWGGGTSEDINLYRGGPGWLKTDGALYAAGDLIAQFGIAYQVAIGKRGPGAESGITFGNSEITLYRYAANVLRTNSAFVADSYIQSAGYFYGSTTTGGLRINGDTDFYRTAANAWAVYSLSANAYGVVYAAVFSVQSDRATKREIETAEVPVDQLLAAGVYTYERQNTEGRHLGLLADELPEAVIDHAPDPEDPNGEGTLEFVDVYKLATALVATVQHLNERITALEAV